MSMFCHQCQETAKNQGCTVRGVCGKSEPVANLQDLLLHVLRGIALWQQEASKQGIARDERIAAFVLEALFATVTNVNFDEASVAQLIERALTLRDDLRATVERKAGAELGASLPDAATWKGERSTFAEKALSVGHLATEDENLRSLRALLTYGVKGIAAYTHHAEVLGVRDESIHDFLVEALAATTRDLDQQQMVELVLKAGANAVAAMKALDEANRTIYGSPEITTVSTGVRNRPGILISGHDLKDLHELLEQSKGTGVDVYTHGEMLPANCYPAFKRYDNLVGNYGGAWYEQKKDFKSFNGPILLTTNCLIPVDDSYRDRIYTTGVVRYPEVPHIADRAAGGSKDFSALIEQASKCPPPTEIENGSITAGFAHDQLMALADKVVGAVKSGAIKRFVVMAGCDGRHKSREYFTEVAKALPPDTVILTAGCAKYRYNKLDLGDIGGIPRVLDAGQCNDSYSLAVIALKLKEVFGLDDVNQLPLSLDVGWYEQKAVAVLLALLHLGFKHIRLGPTLPAFLSPAVAELLVKTFDIKPTTDAASDVSAIMEGD